MEYWSNGALELSAVRLVRRRRASYPFVTDNPLNIPAEFVSHKISPASFKVNVVTVGPLVTATKRPRRS
jgi:hypothetical protein